MLRVFSGTNNKHQKEENHMSFLNGPWDNNRLNPLDFLIPNPKDGNPISDFWDGFNPKPKPRVDPLEKLNLIFTDVETEGKKQGYSRAAKQYEEVYRSLENTYKQAIESIEAKTGQQSSRLDMEIWKLEALEKQKKSLEEQKAQKVNSVSAKYNIPASDVAHFVSSGDIFSRSESIIDIIYDYKERKLRKAEESGYLEAKKIYEEKISKLRHFLEEKKTTANADLQKLINMETEILDSISKIKMEIADLELAISLGEN